MVSDKAELATLVKTPYAVINVKVLKVLIIPYNTVKLIMERKVITTSCHKIVYGYELL